jgi:hypothetical protein
VRDVGKVNLSLLIKWRWRLLQKENAFWKEILVVKYGPYMFVLRCIGLVVLYQIVLPCGGKTFVVLT